MTPEERVLVCRMMNTEAWDILKKHLTEKAFTAVIGIEFKTECDGAFHSGIAAGLAQAVRELDKLEKTGG